MKWPGSHRDGHAIEIKDDLTRWRSDFDEPLPPVTRSELLRRLGIDVDEAEIIQATSSQATPSRISDVKAVAAA